MQSKLSTLAQMLDKTAFIADVLPLPDFVRRRVRRRPSEPRRTGIIPMPPEHIAGPGRNPRFDEPQYFAEVGGLRTAISDSGPHDGPALVFLHGLASNLTYWLNVAPHFADRARIICVDLPGCGESESPSHPYGIDFYADHIAALLDTLGIERATLVGHSMGGAVSTEFGLKYPERCERLVLVNPAGFQRLPIWMRVGGRQVMRAGVLSTLLPVIWRGVLSQVFYRDNAYTRDFIENVANTSVASRDIPPLAEHIAALRHDLVDREYTDDVLHLKVPVWLIWGEEDRLVPAKWIRRTAQRVAQVECEEIPTCGHMPIIEAPDEVVAFIARALGRDNPAAGIRADATPAVAAAG